jgi:hypothetical protein
MNQSYDLFFWLSQHFPRRNKKQLHYYKKSNQQETETDAKAKIFFQDDESKTRYVQL